MNSNPFSNASGTDFGFLVAKTKWALRNAREALADDKARINKATDDCVTYQVRAYAEGIMKYGSQVKLLEQLAYQLEKVAFEALEDLASDKALDFWWDEQAKRIRRYFSAFLIQTIFRGVDHSSNPLGILEDRANVQAAKMVLQYVLGLDEYAIGSHIGLVLHAIAEEEAEQARKDGLKPDELRLYWHDVEWRCVVILRNGDADESTRRAFGKSVMDARVAAKLMRSELSLDSLPIKQYSKDGVAVEKTL